MQTYFWTLIMGAGLMGITYLWGRQAGASNERRKQAEQQAEVSERVTEAIVNSPTSKSDAIDELRKSGRL